MGEHKLHKEGGPKEILVPVYSIVPLGVTFPGSYINLNGVNDSCDGSRIALIGSRDGCGTGWI
jgi:hypothetical protein